MTLIDKFNLVEPDPKKLATLRSDVTLSSCEVRVKSKKCDENGCGEGSLDVAAVTDFIEDGDRTSRLATARVIGKGTYGWKAFDPPDVEVIKRVKTDSTITNIFVYKNAFASERAS